MWSWFVIICNTAEGRQSQSLRLPGISLGRPAACNCPLDGWRVMLNPSACCRCGPKMMRGRGQEDRDCRSHRSLQPFCPMTTRNSRFLSFFLFVYIVSPAVLTWKDLDWPGKGPFRCWWKFIEVSVSQLATRKIKNILSFWPGNQVLGVLEWLLSVVWFSSPTLNPEKSFSLKD